MTKSLCALCSSALVLALCARANADGVAGVLAVTGDGIEPGDLSTITTTITAGLRAASWQLPKKPLGKDDEHQLVVCLGPQDGKCTPPFLMLQNINATLVVTVSKTESAQGDHGLVLTGRLNEINPIWASTHQSRCSPCNVDSIAKAATDLVTELLHDMAIQDGRTLISVKTDPDNALVYLDDDSGAGGAAGATHGTDALVIKTYPGPHTVRIEKPGYAPISDRVVVDPGRTASLAVTLSPTSDANIAHSSHRPWWVAPVVLYSVGGVVALGGIPFLVLGEHGTAHYNYSRAAGIGGGMIGLGAALVIAGGITHYFEKRKHTPTVSITDRGAVFGIAGTF